ncbi:MAG: hypothetical protein ACJ76F_08315 [Bacteroidia bacterium]
MKAFLILSSLLLPVLSSPGQDSTAYAKRARLSGVSVVAGLSAKHSNAMSTALLLKICPELSTKDYLNYTLNNSGYSVNPNEMISVNALFDLYNTRRKSYSRRQLFLGLAYYKDNELYSGYIRSWHKRIDTLYSSSGAPELYRDSVSLDNYSLNYVNHSIALDLQQVFSTSSDKIVSIFFGYGLSFNYSINSQIKERYNSVRGLSSSSSPMFSGTAYLPQYGAENYKFYHSQQSYTAKRSIAYKIFVPLGINFRLSQKRHLLSKVVLSLQARVGVDFLQLPGQDMYRSLLLSALSGLNYRF